LDQFGNRGSDDQALPPSPSRRRPSWRRPSWKVVTLAIGAVALTTALVAGVVVVQRAFDDFGNWKESPPPPETRVSQPVEPPPSTRPALGTYVRPVLLAVEAVPLASRADATVVAEAVREVAVGDGIRVEHDTQGGVVGVSATRGSDCVLVRVGAEVEVWSPGQVSPVYRNPGDSSCSPYTAIQRGYQHAPH
jgi:hypothetical protein